MAYGDADPAIPDLSHLINTIDESDDDDDNRPRVREAYAAADLVADLQRNQQQNRQNASRQIPASSSDSIVGSPFGSHSTGSIFGGGFGAAFAPHTEPPAAPSSHATGSPESVLRFFSASNEGSRSPPPGTVGAQKSEKVSANMKALQALQHRSRNRDAPPVAQPPAPVVVATAPPVQDKSGSLDPGLYGSLPADIGSLDCTVYIQYLPVTMREFEFMNLICQHGDPRRVRICGNPKKEHNWTYGFVEYGSPEEATNFIANCDGVRAGPFRMRCNIAKTPIVDRLAIDAPPDGKCTFAQKFPNRTLRELILASITVADDHVPGHSPAGTAAAGGRVAASVSSANSAPGSVDLHGHGLSLHASALSMLSIPDDYASEIMSIIKRDALQFATDRNQSSFYAAKHGISVVLEHVKRRNENLPPQRYLASLLRGTDGVLMCRLLLTVLHVLHGSTDEALRYALSALQSMPTTLAVVNYTNNIDSELDAVGAPRGYSALLLNHIASFGLALETVSAIAARAFYQLAYHRATIHGINVHRAVTAALAADPKLSPSPAPQSRSILRSVYPLLLAVDSGFAGFLIAYFASGHTLEQSCVALFSNPTPGASESGSPALHTRATAPW